MLNFHYNIPTEIFFGKGQIEVLGREIRKYGSKVLLVYGGGSIKKTGLYDEVTKILKENNIHWMELSGVDPNPRITSVREGIRLCRDNDLDFVLAVGGGSVIDCSKFIAAGYYYKGDPWDFCIAKATVGRALPLASILTIAATGSEMNKTAVISNMESNQKLSGSGVEMSPKFSILDPVYTYTLPKTQIAAGTVDIMSHIFEVYFTPTKGVYIENCLAEALLKTVFKYGLIAYEEPENYEARANLMWASSLAINGLLACGKETNWSVHAMEHELSAFYDITHGVGLGILTPCWMEYILNENTVEDIATYGVNVWGLNKEDDLYEVAKKAINNTREFIKSLGIPMKLRDVGIEKEKLSLMAEQCVKNKEIKLGTSTVGNYPPLKKEDILEIYKRAY